MKSTNPKESKMARNRTFGEAAPVQTTAQTTMIEVPATDPQRNFIRVLLDERDLFTGKLAGTPDEQRVEVLEGIKAQVETISKKAASKWIEQLMSLPKLETAPTFQPASTPDVPNGRYAILGSEIDGDHPIHFFKVSTPDQGKWAGFTFVDEQAGPNYFPVKARDRKNAILAAIANDPREAAIRYGHELGVCGVCGTELTNEESRAYGIGPVCRNKTGW